VLTSTQDLVSLGRRLNLQPPVVDFRQVGDLEGRELSTAEAHAKLRASSARVPDIEQAAAGAGGQHLADDVRRSPASSLLM
jgi:hypothetical protein